MTDEPLDEINSRDCFLYVFIIFMAIVMESNLSLIHIFGMRREEIYLTNIVKCHPPNNRDPRQEEQESCIIHGARI